MDLMVRSIFDRFRLDRELAALAESEAFEAFAGWCVLSAFHEAAFDPDAFRVGGGEDLGVDVYGIVVNGDLMHDAADVRDAVARAGTIRVRVVIVQAKTSGSFDGKTVTDLADNLEHILGSGEIPYGMGEGVRELRACVEAIFEDLAKLDGVRPELHVRYVTTGAKVSQHIGQKCRTAQKKLSRLDRFEEVTFECVTGTDLRELYERAKHAVSATVTMPRKVALPPAPGVEQSFQGLLPARELVDELLTDDTGGIRKTLFHENVRDFQGYNEVNTEIKDTLLDETRRQRFAVLNNGITIVTRGLNPVGDDLRLSDYQIVNGCQTCHVLFDNRSALTDDVQVRVSIVHSVDDEVITAIVAATNRQTVITTEDLSARESFHKDLEQYFAACTAPRHLRYERRARQYADQPDIEKARVISRSQLTRAYTALVLDDPVAACRYRALATSRADDLYRPDHNPLTYYTAASAWYRLERLIRNGHVDSGLRTALPHLIMAVRTRILGRALAKPPKAHAADCAKLLDKMWDPIAAERLLLEIAPAIERALKAERGTTGEAVRTRRFTDRVRAELRS